MDAFDKVKLLMEMAYAWSSIGDTGRASECLSKSQTILFEQIDKD